MPYAIKDTSSPKGTETTLSAWPHQSMTRGGFVTFIGATAVLLAMPLVSVLGTPVLWGLLPFMLAALGGVWLAVNRNQKDAALREVLTLTPELLKLERHEPGGRNKYWEANPYWVSIQLYPGSKPVEKYLTLRGGGREVELGAFLSPDEREALHDNLNQILSGLRDAPPPRGRP